MKKILATTALVLGLAASSVAADPFGRSYENATVGAAVGHNFATSATTLTAKGGVGYSLSAMTRLYAHSSYELRGNTWNGLTVGVVFKPSESVFVDSYVARSGGQTVGTIEVGVNF